MATYTITATPSGSSKDNDAQRDIAAVFPFDANQYRTISEIVRRDGIWCSCGGSSQSVTMAGYDQLIDSASGTVIKTSDTGTCKSHGTGPAAENYMTCTFADWTQAESNAAVAAWKAGTLIIRRTVYITSYTSSGHGEPTFRDGYYDDTITITGSTLPFTDYRPQIVAFSCMRSEDGVTEVQLCESVYATIQLSMNNVEGLKDSPSLLLEYSTTSDFRQNVVGIYLGMYAGAISPYLSGKTIQVSGEFSVGSAYYFRLTFIAGEEVAQYGGVSVGMSYTPIHIPQNNAGVALGMYSNATDDDRRFECNYPAYFYGGIAQIGSGEANPLFAVPGETLVVSSNAILPGFASGGRKDIYISVPMGKLLANVTGVQVESIVGWVRNDGGYGLTSGFIESGNDYTSLVTRADIDRATNSIMILIQRSSAFYVTNNQAITFVPVDLRLAFE